ncbi:hypothetical protein HCU40_09805 [Pseudanabaena biceps]|nr:hypothetical protein [Pseudanabaena biceps]
MHKQNLTFGIFPSLFVLSFVFQPLSTQALTLYNGTLSNRPSQQGQIGLGALSSSGTPLTSGFVASSETVITNGVRLVSNGSDGTNSAEYAGYSNYNPLTTSFLGSSSPIIQSNQYSLSFTFALTATTSNSNDRAAFSVTAIGMGNMGIEIGWEDTLVFAQNSSLTRGESGAVITNTKKTYVLTVNGGLYDLSESGTSLISGSLRSYNFVPALSSPPLTFNPYTTPGFLFFGDDTGQEFGTFEFFDANVQSIPFDFSPTGGLLMLGAIASARHLYKKHKSK